MSQAAAPSVDYAAIIADPLFREGYEEIWSGRESAVDVRWSDAEAQAYQNGRRFGEFVSDHFAHRLPLRSGGSLHPMVRPLLVRAVTRGVVA